MQKNASLGFYAILILILMMRKILMKMKMQKMMMVTIRFTDGRRKLPTKLPRESEELR